MQRIRRKWALAAAAVLTAASLLIVPSPASARADLTTRLAHYYMRKALRQFDSFRTGYGRTACRERLAMDRVRCYPRWKTGNTAFHGHGQIWFTYEGHQAHWNYTWTIWEVDEACVRVGGSPDKCTTKHVVKAKEPHFQLRANS